MAGNDAGNAGRYAFSLSRRDVLKTTKTAALAAAITPLSGVFAKANGNTMRDHATRFMASLDENLTEAALFDFDSTRRGRWNYMLGSRPAPGARLEHMNDEQKSLALDLFRTGLSSDGFETAMNIMLQQDILRDEWGKGSPDRNRERFSLMIFGTPSATDPWAWRFEGHHLTITYTLIGDEIIAHTPKAFSSEPNTVPSGPHRGLVVLPENETLGRVIFADMGDSARRQALLSENSIGNITTAAGREFRYTEKQGVALGDLGAPQVDKVLRLIDLYTKNHLSADLAREQEERLDGQDMMGVHFAWTGPNRENESMYYRIHGDTFLIEFATLRNQPQHHHTAVHDLERNLGMHRL